MILHTLKHNLARIIGVGLLSFTLFSCTYDYFEDENNFLVYVPQIKEGTISNYYISFHDEAGNHVVTRTISLPIDFSNIKNTSLQEGILKFKIKPGNYTITSFADCTLDKIVQGESFDNSCKEESVCDPSQFGANNNICADDYIICETNPRFLLTKGVTVYPIGHEQSNMPVEIDMNEKTRYKGRVDIDFVGLGSQVARIDIAYKGVGSMLHFNGYVGIHNDNDRVYASYKTAEFMSGNTISLNNNLLYPSAGCETNIVTRSVPSTQLPLELAVTLYDSSNAIIGEFEFTNADFMALSADKKPKDENGNPLTSLILEPRKTIKFTFKEFIVVSIELTGWGDTINGGVTPM